MENAFDLPILLVPFHPSSTLYKYANCTGLDLLIYTAKRTQEGEP